MLSRDELKGVILKVCEKKLRNLSPSSMEYRINENILVHLKKNKRNMIIEDVKRKISAHDSKAKYKFAEDPYEKRIKEIERSNLPDAKKHELTKTLNKLREEEDSEDIVNTFKEKLGLAKPSKKPEFVNRALREHKKMRETMYENERLRQKNIKREKEEKGEKYEEEEEYKGPNFDIMLMRKLGLLETYEEPKIEYREEKDEDDKISNLHMSQRESTERADISEDKKMSEAMRKFIL
jgi:hypothetical protein